MNAFIYCLTDPRTKEIRYVGKTINLKKRFYEHKTDFKSCPRKSNWLKNLRRDEMIPEMDVLQTIENSNDCDWQEHEFWWITYLRFIGCPLTNLDSGRNGKKMPSQETREKIRRAHLGRIVSAETGRKISIAKTGFRHSEETKRKIREAKARNPQTFSEEYRKRVSDKHRGKKYSDETRQKMSDAQKGRIVSAAARKKISLAQLGRKQTPERIAHRLAKVTGRKRTPEQCERISAAKLAAFAERRLRNVQLFQT